MKPFILIPIIIGSVLLVAGGAIFAVGIAKANTVEVVNEEYDLSDKDFTNFKFDLDVTDIEFKVSEGSEKKVVLRESKKVHHEVSVNENTLSIVQHDNRKWYEYAFNFVPFNMKATIYLPAGSYENLDIKNETGDLLIPENYTFNNLVVNQSTGGINVKADVLDSVKIKVSTGDISLYGMNPKSVEMNASTGDIKLEKFNVENDISINYPKGGSTGNLDLVDVHSKNVNLRTSTGHIHLTNVIASNGFDLKSSTGNIKFDGCDANTILAKTSTGDIKGTLLTGKIFTTKTSTGRPNVPPSIEGHGTCSLETSTGNINISIKQ